MKCAIVFVSFLVAAASAGYAGHGATSYASQSHFPSAGHAAPIAHGYSHGGHYGSEARLVDPVAIAAGAPLPVGDTYEVAAAKAAHFKAHAIARGQAHGYSHSTPVDHGHSHASPLAHGYSHVAPVSHGYAHAAPVAHGYAHAAPIAHGYSHGGHYGSEARLIDPVAIAAGAPLPGGDTYEVAAAKAAHFKAHAAAKNNHLGHY